jgi:hypothetical protein
MKSKVGHAASLATLQLAENKRKRSCYPETHFALPKHSKSESPAKKIFRGSELQRRHFSHATRRALAPQEMFALGFRAFPSRRSLSRADDRSTRQNLSINIVRNYMKIKIGAHSDPTEKMTLTSPPRRYNDNEVH